MNFLKIPRKIELEAGVLDNNYVYTDPITHKPGANIAQVAYWNVKGAKNIPERNFFAHARDKLQGLQKELIKEFVKKSVKADAKDEFASRLGIGAANILRREIIDFSTPPNSPATIARKGRNDPLVDTGHLMNYINWRKLEV